MMTDTKDESKIFRVQCPHCKTWLWVDPVTREVIRTERGKKDKGSLDDLLIKEKKRKLEFDRKFEATAELQKERRKKAKEEFDRALTNIDEES